MRKEKKQVNKHLSDIESSGLLRSESDNNIPSPSVLITNGKYLFSLEIILLGYCYN